MSRIAVLGAGSWGTALCLSLCRPGRHAVTLWAHTPTHAAAMRQERENRRYLPGFALPDSLAISASLEETLTGAEMVLVVVPSQHLRGTLEQARPHLPAGAMLLSAAKGVEDGTVLRMTEVIAELLGGHTHPVGTLSGPSFAQEVAAGQPTAITAAFARNEDAVHAQAMLSSDSLRVYRNTDVVGVELGGALKNVIAIAAGAVAGLGLGANSLAALITRGIAEITRLAMACGGRQETLAGLAGLGDLVLTCTGSLSRNRYVGQELGRGRRLEEIVAALDGKVAEGVRTTHAALGLAAKTGVEMPIATEVQAVLNGEHSAAEAVRALMGRPGGDETRI